MSIDLALYRSFFLDGTDLMNGAFILQFPYIEISCGIKAGAKAEKNCGIPSYSLWRLAFCSQFGPRVLPSYSRVHKNIIINTVNVHYVEIMSSIFL